MSTTPELRAHLDHAIAQFDHAWTTGEWQPFFDLFVDEGFIFQFPAGSDAGRWTGPDAYEHANSWRRTHEAHDRITETHENLRLYDDHWIIVADQGEGTMGGKPYNGVEIVLIKVTDDGRIAEYREYIGGLTDLQ